MKGKYKNIANKMRQYSWEWIIVGVQLLATGTAIWYNALHDVYLHPAFALFSKPLWVFLPFIIGGVTVYCGIATGTRKQIKVLTLAALAIYWTMLTTLLYINDTFNNHISIIAVITTFIVFKVWLMAFRL